METKICIIGNKDCGKTTFIKNVLLEEYKEGYLIIDTMGEYDKSLYNVDNLNFPNKVLEEKEYKKLIINLITNNKNKTIILDSVRNIIALNSYKWLFDILDKYILTLYNTRKILSYADKIDKVYYLGKINDYENKFINKLKKTTNVINVL